MQATAQTASPHNNVSSPSLDGIFSPEGIQEHLPGEPLRPPLTLISFLRRLILRVPLLILLAVVTSGLWPVYFLAVLIWGWPPNVPRVPQILRYLRLTWTEKPPAPGLSVPGRIWITLSIVRKVMVIPVWGLAWLLDEMLYGTQLKATPVVAPLIEISAARSGSTQLARYLEEDPHLAAPSMLQSVFPYLWLWRLVPKTLGRFVSADQVRHKMETALPPEFIQRHEGDPFRTDTFDGALYIAHLNTLCMFLGPAIAVDDFGFGRLAPHNRTLWEQDFVDLMDGIARKTLLQAGPGPDGKPRRFFVKGHFLCAGDALERKYPDARFITMIREPGPRLQSGVNFMRANPVDGAMGAVPWTWLGETLVETETLYCDIEQVWYTRQGTARRCVLRFSEYVKDLESTMKKVYRECLDMDTLPPHVPTTHPPRERTNYLLNRSLAQVGVNEAALNARLAGYIAWCRGQ